MKYDNFITKSTEYQQPMSLADQVDYYKRYRTKLVLYLPESKDQFKDNNNRLMKEINLIDGYILSLQAKIENELY